MRCELDGGSCIYCGQCEHEEMDEQWEREQEDIDYDEDDGIQDHPGELIGAFEG